MKLAEESGIKISLINYGSVMVRLSQEGGKLLHRDNLRRTKLLFQNDLQAKAAGIIAQKIEEEGDIIIDTHMSIKTAEGYWAGLPFHVLQRLNPNIFVLIEAEPKEVLNRRLKDIARKRDKVLESEIEEEFSFSRIMAASCAVLTGASVKIIYNHEGKQVKAASEILKLLNR